MKTAGPMDMPRNFPINAGLVAGGKNPNNPDTADPFDDFPSLLGAIDEAAPEKPTTPLNSKPVANDSLSEGFYVRVDVPSLESMTEKLPEEMQATIAELNGILQPGRKLQFSDPTGSIISLAQGLRAGGSELSVSDTFGAPVKQQPLFTVTDKAQMHLASLNALATTAGKQSDKPQSPMLSPDVAGKPSLPGQPIGNNMAPVPPASQQPGFSGSGNPAGGLSEADLRPVDPSDTEDTNVRIGSISTAKPSQVQVMMPAVTSIGNFGQTLVTATSGIDTTQPQTSSTAVEPNMPASQPTIRSIEIQLVPKSLGVVEVKMTIANGQLNIAVQTQSADAEKILQSELKSIGETLAKAGLTVEEISVTHNPNLEQNAANQRGQRQETASQLDFNFSSENQPSSDDQTFAEHNKSDYKTHDQDISRSSSRAGQQENRSGIYL